MKHGIFVAALWVLAATSGFTQLPEGPAIRDEPPGGFKPAQPPPLSPPAKTSVTINGEKITINYSAPSMRKRVIFVGPVPFGQVWRADQDGRLARSVKTGVGDTVATVDLAVRSRR